MVQIGKMIDAESEYRHAIELRRGVLAQSSNNPNDRLAWAEIHLRLGTFFMLIDRLGDATAILRTARDALERLVADFPDKPQYQGLLGTILNDSGLVALNLKDFREARTLFDQAIVRQQAALRTDSQNRRYRDLVAHSQQMLALALKELGQRDEAEKTFRQCIATGEGLAADFPSFPHHREDLGKFYGNLATLMLDMGPDRRDEGARLFRQATRRMMDCFVCAPRRRPCWA